MSHLGTKCKLSLRRELLIQRELKLCGSMGPSIATSFSMNLSDFSYTYEERYL